MEIKVGIAKDIHEIRTKWVGKMHFISNANGHDIHLDKLAVHGGDDTGPRPKQLILSAISGCTGMEIVSILEKMRVKLEGLEIEVTGELTEEIPKMYKAIHIVFRISCEKVHQNKVEKAIQLAYEKYCGVVAMVRRFATVTAEVKFV